jgi:misacylated tRNA(Ala) deacylase
MPPTERLYWDDDHLREAEAVCVAVHHAEDGLWLAFDRTCFYPGGGGQPSDAGTIDGSAVFAIRVDTGGVIWHQVEGPGAGWPGRRVTLRVDAPRRDALSRYHTVLHVLNTIALRDYHAWITGAQIASDYARIDFRWDGFSPALREELERKVNAELSANRPLRSYWLTEEEFTHRADLRRTLEVEPPVINGRVRVVEIAGFDAQACGGTHVHTTADLGRFSITKTENKGKINKRLYVSLTL